MSDFKTGDLIIVSDWYPVLPTSTRMKYLCTINSTKHLCVSPMEWEEGDFSNIIEYKFIDKPRTVLKVRKASDIVKWLEDNGYRPTMRGSWLSMKERHLLFDKSMFIECGKNFGDVKNQDCFMDAWLEEVEL